MTDSATQRLAQLNAAAGSLDDIASLVKITVVEVEAIAVVRRASEGGSL